VRCRCGHLDGEHFDEVGACSGCACARFQPPRPESPQYATVGEAYTAGYRNGFEAGKLAQLRDSAQIEATLAELRNTPARRRQPTPANRRCHDCGHADTTHNELGYCQARGKAGSDGCHCSNWVPPCLYVECEAVGVHRVENHLGGTDWYCDEHIANARLGA